MRPFLSSDSRRVVESPVNERPRYHALLQACSYPNDQARSGREDHRYAQVTYGVDGMMTLAQLGACSVAGKNGRINLHGSICDISS